MYYVSISIVMVSWMPIWRDVTRYILYSPPFFQENPPRYSFQNFFLLSIHLSPTSFCRIQLEWFVWRYSRIRFFFTLSPTQLTRWDYIVLWNTWQFRILRLPMNLTTAETMRKHRPTHTHNHTILYRPCVYTETKIFSLLFFSLVLNSCSFLLELTSCVFFLICFFCSNNRFFFVAISLFHLFFWYFVFYCLALNFLRKKTTFVCLFKQCCKTLNVWIVQKKNGNILFVAEVAQLWCEIC